jgi:hypothetical protein
MLARTRIQVGKEAEAAGGQALLGALSPFASNLAL